MEKLSEYRRKRDFSRTREPSGDAAAEAVAGRLYVMHKHAASHDHFDLRLEQDGVLRSWALPKGPSLAPGEKRLAVEVEDHPLAYGSFEGVIPEGEYGGGTSMLWDAGEWRVIKNDTDHIDFELHGQKLRGTWTLVRTRGGGKRRQRGAEGKNWLLIKRSDKRKVKLEPDDRSVMTGRTMDEIARARDNVWIEGAAVHAPDPAAIQGARKGALPEEVKPQLATLSDTAPEGDDWVHELKYDGYRLLACIDAGEVRLFTRNGHNWTARFPEIAKALRRLPVKHVLLDGEVVAMASDGSTSFRKLQEALSERHRRSTEELFYQVFDLLHLQDHDLTPAALLDRKHALRQLLRTAGFSGMDRVRYSDHIQGKGQAFYEQVCQLGLEGIISKRTDARYRSGRGRQWLKVKCTSHAEFVVGGFTPPGGARSGFGSLLLGAFKSGDFIYAGRVGTGFSERQLDELHAHLKQLAVNKRPFVNEVPDARAATWVKPELVVEVEFTERTRDGRLRHPVFRGVRDDRDPEEISLNGDVSGDIDMSPQSAMHRGEHATRRRKSSDARVAGVRITHPDRVMYPEQGATKLDLARYYEDIQDWMLPYIANRPLSLLRCPEGRQTECFFQKHPGHALAKNVPRVEIEERKGKSEYVYVNNVAHLVALVQAGVLEFHPWGAQVDDVEHPDFMVFDLDPAPDVGWNEMLRVAKALRELLDSLAFASFPRTTGGKGLHLVVPLKPKADWDEVKDFAKAVSERLAAEDPARLTTNMAKNKRGGKIFIDYLRNGRGATAIASYSIRAREGAPIAVPVRWDELNAALRPDRYTIENLRRRLGSLRQDPWDGFFDARAVISAKARKAVGLK